jgi:SAM-dependent methyltransferase
VDQAMTKCRCPACGGEDIESLTTICAQSLIELYYKSARIDVAPYFAGVMEIVLRRCRGCDLQFYDPPCPGDGAFYGKLQQFDWYYKEEKAEFGFASQFARAGSHVLEVGCGSGAFHDWLPTGADYTGLEFSERAVEAARARGLNVIKQSIEEHSHAHAGAYGLVCAFQVLEHVINPCAFFQACVKALAPRGVLVLTVPAEDSYLHWAVNLYLNLPPHHASRWTDQALTNAAMREGLTVREIWHEPLAKYHEVMKSKVLARQFINLCLGRNHKLVDLGAANHLINAALRWTALRQALAARATKSLENMAVGHTVGIVATPSSTVNSCRGPAL